MEFQALKQNKLKTEDHLSNTCSDNLGHYSPAIIFSFTLQAVYKQHLIQTTGSHQVAPF